MTLKELMTSDKAYITPAEAASLMECDPNWIRQCAAKKPEFLPFRVMRCGNRTKIPRIAFINFLEGQP